MGGEDWPDRPSGCGARKPRLEVAPGMYRVSARGNCRRRLFLDDDDRLWYLRKLGAVTVYRRWGTMSYCLMNNHVHALIETIEPNLGLGMQALQGGYAQRFNKRHGTTGHVFERRFGAVPVKDDAQLQIAAAYIALNPTSGRMCRAPEDWRWGSHATILGAGVPRPHWLAVTRLLEFFSSAGGDPLQ